MASMPLPPPPLPTAASQHRHHTLPLLLPAATAAAFTSAVLLLLLFFFYFHLSHRRRSPTLPLSSSPSSSPTLRRFSFRSLRSATLHFDPSRSLGRGASAAVFRGILPDGKSVAIKRLNPSFPDRDFQNELKVLADLPHSPFIVSLLGYCNRRPHYLLVYEYMSNGSLQEALFGSSHPFIDWDRRFRIILDIAKALAFLHLQCDPPVIHGDVKPANVLLGSDFQAKLADFGLSRRKTDIFSHELCLSPQVDLSLPFHSPNHEKKASLKGKDLVSNPCCDVEVGFVDKFSELGGSSPLDDGRIDWWWKQDESEELSSRDYVREWIGNQICPSKNPDWDDDRKSSPELRSSSQMEIFEQKSLDETVFTDIDAQTQNNKLKTNVEARCDKERKMREWWKEEYFAEISKRGKNCKGLKWLRNNKLGEMDISFRKGWKKRKNQSVGSEILNSDLYSKELSSTTSMRGTICYVAPEYGGFSHIYEKADIYSFGVLVLVIVSGRRPLHVQESPMKLDRANLISWCRQLALVGDVMEILDEKLKDSCDKDQVHLCINLALLCLQRTPELRPDSGEIVKILKGEMEIPAVPLETSNSPISRSMRRTKQDSA
ncbi:hypothetical protein KFK09_017640 [Dendrobium nobile]|uniref:Protein kinase domain-containing protein n=1 Tax=Dendrobium nobile TaxID=94219 RepID=A0A8T3B1U1_DENNO|nr:hypothetical protein KFK09_017640 [Dendrobium nobile]